MPGPATAAAGSNSWSTCSATGHTGPVLRRSHRQGHATSLAQIVDDVLRLSITDVEVMQGDTATVPLGLLADLDETVFFDPKDMPASSATHVAVVEVDPPTGHIGVSRHIVVDDRGRRMHGGGRPADSPGGRRAAPFPLPRLRS